MWSVWNTTLAFTYNVHKAVLVTGIFYSSSCDKLVNRVVHFLRWLLMFCLHAASNIGVEISDSNSKPGHFFLAGQLSFAFRILNLLSGAEMVRTVLLRNQSLSYEMIYRWEFYCLISSSLSFDLPWVSLSVNNMRRVDNHVYEALIRTTQLRY